MSLCVIRYGVKSSGSLGWSHRGRLQRQPSWKWWYRPGTVCFCLRACLPYNLPVPRLQFFFLFLFFSPIAFFLHLLCLPPPQPCKQSHLQTSKNTSGEGKERNGEMNVSRRRCPPPNTHHRRPSSHPLVILPSSFE